MAAIGRALGYQAPASGGPEWRRTCRITAPLSGCLKALRAQQGAGCLLTGDAGLGLRRHSRDQTYLLTPWAKPSTQLAAMIVYALLQVWRSSGDSK